MTDWNADMDAAPKDGTKVLVFQSGNVHFARWDDDQYAKTPRPFWHGTFASLWGKNEARRISPTHWMPLPPPPTEGE